MSSVAVSKLHTLTGHRDCLYTLASSGQKNRFFSAGGDGMVAEWDLHDPENGQLIANLPASIYAMLYLEDQNYLVVGQNFEGIHIIDLNDKKEVGSLKLTDAAIFDLKYWEGKLFIASGDGHLTVVDLQQMAVIFQERASLNSARCIAINQFRNEWAVGFSDHSIRVFSLSDHTMQTHIKAHKNSVFSLVYAPDNSLLLSAGRDAHLKVWNAEKDYELKESIAAHMYAINHLEFSPTGHHFVTCSMDKSIKVWDFAALKLLKVIDKARHAGHATSVNKLLWSGYQDLLVSCSDDRTISVWDLKIS